jgi:hypothetical protein
MNRLGAVKINAVVGDCFRHCYVRAMGQITISDLFQNPDFYMFGWEDDQAIFLNMNRQSYAKSIFFDDRIVTADDQVIRVPLAPLLNAVSQMGAAQPRIGWIFHMAHTGSTLLARALDCPGKKLVIREPASLRALGVEARSFSSDWPPNESWGQRLNLALAMLDKRYSGDEAVIVKANVPVNGIIPNLLANAPNPRALLLHFGLEDYLTAILRSPNHRKWVERIVAELQLESQSAGPSGEPQHAEKAAALWFFQIGIYADVLAANPSVRSLDANILFDEPLKCLKAASDYFGCPINDDAARTIIGGELFSTYSKNPDAAFDNVRRKERVSETRTVLAEEFKLARNWVEARLAGSLLPTRLERPLCGENPALL